MIFVVEGVYLSCVFQDDKKKNLDSAFLSAHDENLINYLDPTVLVQSQSLKNQLKKSFLAHISLDSICICYNVFVNS